MESSIITNHDRVTTLLKREAERQLDLQKKHNEKKLINAEHEQYNYFTRIFQEKVKEIEARIDSSLEVEQKQIAFHFDKISRDIHSLQKFVGDSVIFLRNYDIRICQEALQEIETKSRKLEEQLLPKKKFGFKNKRNAARKTKDDPGAMDTSNGQTKDDQDEVDQLKKESQFKFNTDENFYGLKNQKNANLFLAGDSLFKKDVMLQNLDSCVVKLNGSASTLHITSLMNCTIISGPVATSIFVEDCKNCNLILACQQLRLHSSSQCDIYLHVTSRAIIEDCKEINVAKYNYLYDTLKEDFKKAGLDETVNHWNDLDDFNWLVADKHSPNWKILDESKLISDWDSIVLKP